MGTGLRCSNNSRPTSWPKLQLAWSQGKAHGNTASAVTKVATEDCQTRSSSDTPHVATEDGLSVSTKRVTFALGPKEDRKSNNETGQDKYPKSDKANDPNSNTETEEKQPEGCEKNPKSMEEFEEKPPEGCNNDPKSVTPKPGQPVDGLRA